MNDVMPCQLCGSKRIYEFKNLFNVYEEFEFPWEQMTCGCGLSSSRVYWDSSDGIEPGHDYAVFRVSQMLKHSPGAIEKWNDLQKLIARGLILDNKPKSKGKRL